MVEFRGRALADRWERSLPTALRVEQDDWVRPNRERWVGKLVQAAAATSLPAVFVAHSLGVAAVVHAANKLPAGVVSGAFLVAPADVEAAGNWPEVQGHSWAASHAGFAPLPLNALPFRSVLVASDTDPFCSMPRAKVFAAAWGSELLPAGDAGHINVSSGHGPWPEGLLRFGQFLRSLGPEAAARRN